MPSNKRKLEMWKRLPYPHPPPSQIQEEMWYFQFFFKIPQKGEYVKECSLLLYYYLNFCEILHQKKRGKAEPHFAKFMYRAVRSIRLP